MWALKSLIIIWLVMALILGNDTGVYPTWLNLNLIDAGEKISQ
jgi:hypothetical protein